MTILTKNILDFYDIDKNNNHYLTKYLTNTSHIGFFQPYAENIITSDAKNTRWGTVDEHNTYKINHLGLRGKIDKNADILAPGCSITFGLGIPEDGRWTNILSNKMNQNITNLASPGNSIKNICISTIQYCLNNKIPKVIFGLFPDFFRSMVVVDKDFFQSRHLGNSELRKDLGKDDALSIVYCNPTIYQDKEFLFMEIQDKKFIEDSISPHQLILDSINFIYILESFCLTNNIKLYWTTWDFNTNLLMERLLKIKNFKLKNYTSFFSTGSYRPFDTYVQDRCTLDHNSNYINSIWWNKGSDFVMTDRKKSNIPSHPGIHTHNHVSDFFYDLYNKDLLNA